MSAIVSILRSYGRNCEVDGMARASDDMKRAADEIARLRSENWQLKQACGYPIPADKETPQNPFKCGACDAIANENAKLLTIAAK